VIVGSRVHLINPSDLSFGVAVITPRWLYVLAAATGTEWGDPCLVDETHRIDVSTVTSGDVVGIGIHTGNALRGYEIGRQARRSWPFAINCKCYNGPSHDACVSLRRTVGCGRGWRARGPAGNRRSSS
jgi:hypothetical protein